MREEKNLRRKQEYQRKKIISSPRKGELGTARSGSKKEI